MSEVKKTRSFYNLKSKDKVQSDSTEALIPSSSQTVKKSRSNANMAKPTVAIPPMPEGLPKNLKQYSHMVPGGGTRDMTTPTAPNSPTDYKPNHPTVKTADPWAKAREQQFPERLDRRLNKAIASTRGSDPLPQKSPGRHVHTPRDPATWDAPGAQKSELSLQQVKRTFPSFEKGKVVNTADMAFYGNRNAEAMLGTLARSSGAPDRRGRDVYPEGNKGRSTYKSIANEPASGSKGKSKPGPSVG